MTTDRDGADSRDGAPPPAATSFHDLDAYVALPRLGGLALAPDGSRLVVARSELDTAGTRYVTSLWQVDPTGREAARRLTRGAKGEGGPVLTADGDLLFVAKRAEAGVSEDDAVPALWRLPAGGGEAHVLTRRPAGVSGAKAASSGGAIVVTADTLPAAQDERAEKRLREDRKKQKVSAILHSGYPVRYWDSDVGPDAPRLFAVEGDPTRFDDGPGGTPDDAGAGSGTASSASSPDERGTRDLTPDVGRALDNASWDLAPSGEFLLTTWERPLARGGIRSLLARIDVASGERTTIVDDGADIFQPAVNPDGSLVAYLRETVPTPTQAPTVELWVAATDGSGSRRLVPDWDRWPGSIAWLPDGSGLLVVADDDGHAPVFHVPVAEGATVEDVVRLTAHGAYTHVAAAPDGEAAYALRSSYLAPSEVVRIPLTAVTGGVVAVQSATPSAHPAGFGSDLEGSDQAAEAPPAETQADAADDRPSPDGVVALLGPDEAPALPGDLREVSADVVDEGGEQIPVRGYLALPDGASAEHPAPLLLWIHGGPLGSWNAWSWRWNPWLLVAKGYAVLLPDPALSTGYGQAFVQRGWGAWGGAPYTDLMAITDAVEALPEIDQTRTAAMGGSFGGYMANWVAGHTDRFAAIVTHASLWALDQFGPTTDAAFYWAHEMTPEMALENSPHRHVGAITTPMLVVHGDKDYRVPIGEGLRLWYELLSASGLPADEQGRTEHRFLYFPEENHWVLSPQHAKVWYAVVEAFLARHVLGEERDLPEVLG